MSVALRERIKLERRKTVVLTDGQPSFEWVEIACIRASVRSVAQRSEADLAGKDASSARYEFSSRSGGWTEQIEEGDRVTWLRRRRNVVMRLTGIVFRGAGQRMVDLTCQEFGRDGNETYAA